MKLKFAIRYGTQWGESLYVIVTYRSLDGTEKSSRLAMTTTDGWQWELETSALESRQHPIDSFVYYYQVEDAEGTVLRKEWTMVPRCYHFDSSKNYVLADQWRDIPLQNHLYSNAYRTTAGLPLDDEVKTLRVPLYRKTLLFRVSAPQLSKGQSLAVIGDHPALGCWNTARYLKMAYAGGYDWLLSVDADAIPFPLAYKYVVVDDHTHGLLAWEEGDNRVIDETFLMGLASAPYEEVPMSQAQIRDGAVLVVYGETLRLKEQTWRAAGVAVPLFSLRSTHSYGVGDFGDLRRMVSWAAATGMKLIQLLPVNDTSLSHTWSASNPYRIISAFALHPQYMDLEALGSLRKKSRMTMYYRQRQELNALPYSDYEAVERVKGAYIREIYDEKGKATIESKEFKRWLEENREWLEPYALWLNRRSAHDDDTLFVYYVQYHLHLQLKTAADEARSKGIFIKGDLPIGVNHESVETSLHPEFFNLDCQMGAPPDTFSQNGQNWRFPTYNWSQTELTTWFRRRLCWMAQYFDAVRIDHVLGFFRIWEIPENAVDGLMGHFSPALPMTVGEIEYFGLSFRKDFLTRPFINDRVLDRLFGLHATYVREHFLVNRSYGLYDLKSAYDTQKKVRAYFEGKGDENSLWIRDGLYRLISGVLFLEDPHQPEMYHPRIGAYREPVFDALTAEEKDAYMRLYNNYYYQRHNHFWASMAIRRLKDIYGESKMLCCAEDLGMLPDGVGHVLDQLRMLSLEIQSMPKQNGFEFAHLNANPYRSVATITTHDMSPLRLWWEESPERTQRYYVTMIQKQGHAPEHLPAHLAEEIVARHLYCPSMLCVLSLQDWLAMDGELRSKSPREERINIPGDTHNRWKYRMHLTLEELLDATRYNNKVRTMITRSKR